MAFKDGDMCVLRAPEDEGVYFANIGLDALRAYRREETMGNAYPPTLRCIEIWYPKMLTNRL